MGPSLEKDHPIHLDWKDAIPEPLVDNVGGIGSVIYTGYTRTLGVKETDPKWRITKTSTTGTVTKVEYVNGTGKFDSKWADRAVLTYAR